MHTDSISACAFGCYLDSYLTSDPVFGSIYKFSPCVPQIIIQNPRSAFDVINQTVGNHGLPYKTKCYGIFIEWNIVRLLRIFRTSDISSSFRIDDHRNSRPGSFSGDFDSG